MYKQAIDYERGDARIWNNLAVARIQLEKYEEALSDARQSIALDATYQKGYLRACEALTALGRLEVLLRRYLQEAQQFLKQAEQRAAPAEEVSRLAIRLQSVSRSARQAR